MSEETNSIDKTHAAEEPSPVDRALEAELVVPFPLQDGAGILSASGVIPAKVIPHASALHHPLTAIAEAYGFLLAGWVLRDRELLAVVVPLEWLDGHAQRRGRTLEQLRHQASAICRTMLGSAHERMTSAQVTDDDALRSAKVTESEVDKVEPEKTVSGSALKKGLMALANGGNVLKLGNPESPTNSLDLPGAGQLFPARVKKAKTTRKRARSRRVPGKITGFDMLTKTYFLNGNVAVHLPHDPDPTAIGSKFLDKCIPAEHTLKLRSFELDLEGGDDNDAE